MNKLTRVIRGGRARTPLVVGQMVTSDQIVLDDIHISSSGTLAMPTVKLSKKDHICERCGDFTSKALLASHQRALRCARKWLKKKHNIDGPRTAAWEDDDRPLIVAVKRITQCLPKEIVPAALDRVVFDEELQRATVATYDALTMGRRATSAIESSAAQAVHRLFESEKEETKRIDWQTICKDEKDLLNSARYLRREISRAETELKKLGPKLRGVEKRKKNFTKKWGAP